MLSFQEPSTLKLLGTSVSLENGFVQDDLRNSGFPEATIIIQCVLSGSAEGDPVPEALSLIFSGNCLEGPSIMKLFSDTHFSLFRGRLGQGLTFLACEAVWWLSTRWSRLFRWSVIASLGANPGSALGIGSRILSIGQHAL